MASVTAILWLWAISIFNILVGGLALLVGSSEARGESLSEVSSGIATSSLGFTMMQFGAFAAVAALIAQAVSGAISENQPVIQTTKLQPAAQKHESENLQPSEQDENNTNKPENEAYRRMYGVD